MICNVRLKRNVAERLILNIKLRCAGRELHGGVVESATALRVQVQGASDSDVSGSNHLELIQAYIRCAQLAIVGILLRQETHVGLRVARRHPHTKMPSDLIAIALQTQTDRLYRFAQNGGASEAGRCVAQRTEL